MWVQGWLKKFKPSYRQRFVLQCRNVWFPPLVQVRRSLHTLPMHRQVWFYQARYFQAHINHFLSHPHIIVKVYGTASSTSTTSCPPPYPLQRSGQTCTWDRDRFTVETVRIWSCPQSVSGHPNSRNIHERSKRDLNAIREYRYIKRSLEDFSPRGYLVDLSCIWAGDFSWIWSLSCI